MPKYTAQEIFDILSKSVTNLQNTISEIIKTDNDNAEYLTKKIAELEIRIEELEKSDIIWTTTKRCVYLQD